MDIKEITRDYETRIIHHTIREYLLYFLYSEQSFMDYSDRLTDLISNLSEQLDKLENLE